MIKNILVPVDGSGPSGKALKLAVDIAEKYDANLSVLLVASHEIDKELQNFTNHEYSLKILFALNFLIDIIFHESLPLCGYDFDSRE